MNRPSFRPCPDVAALLNALLDIYERRSERQKAEGRELKTDAGNLRLPPSIQVRLTDLPLPGYFSQVDPEPRLAANEQLGALERLGWVGLKWLPGEQGHLLAAATLVPEHAAEVFDFLERAPLAGRQARLVDLLLGERFRFEQDWRRRAVDRILDQLRAGLSPAPFVLSDEAFNRDLLAALAGLDELGEETSYRVFSVRLFNDSKRFEALHRGLVRLARLSRPEWRSLPPEEVLREFNLVANPGYLYLSGPWHLTADTGEILSLEGFHPAVGLPTAQVSGLQRVMVQAPAVLCIENATTFYEQIRLRDLRLPGPPASLCLWGNPSPACRRLLRLLAADLPDETPLLAWADLDYGGFNILSQLRKEVSERFQPYRMDIETLEGHARLARPLRRGDERRLRSLLCHPELADVYPVVEHLLHRGLKLEQEAIALRDSTASMPA